MGIYKWEQVADIIIRNPNKSVIAKGREMCDKNMLHLYGRGMESAIKHCKHFADDDMYKVQKEYAVSNIDLFGRVLQQEDMVFTAKGGSSSFGLQDSQERQMNIVLGDVSYGLPLRKWIRNFALPAYRSDPMGVIFIEIDQLAIDAAGQIVNEPRAYPTYKSTHCIHDYLSNGRKLEYISFQLTVADARSFGVQDEELKNTNSGEKTEYFRFVDDAKDLIVKRKDDNISLVTNITQRNPLPNEWKRTPAFVISDLIQFYDPQIFVTPLYYVIELADCFLYDRSVRDLQKKKHGFSKAVEPLLNCGTCSGSKYVAGSACPDCTPPGGEPTGFKLKTKPADVARFPLSVFEAGGFDFNRIFGYVTPDIKGWEKQDMSLADLEVMIKCTYWGTSTQPKTSGPSTGQGQEETATKTDYNNRPTEARLNMTADWCESTENLIAGFISEYWFDKATPSIAYGRDYILKTPDELMEIYQTLRTKGAPDFCLDEALEKYYQAKYLNNPVQLAKYLKMLDVEPFPHISVLQAKPLITDFNEFNCKLYFGEWANTVPDAKWVSSTITADTLRNELREYVKAKGLKEPVQEPNPALN
jgi:hypothetical protein